jgi:RimJ/RimL family protein N-acetyltransferase
MPGPSFKRGETVALRTVEAEDLAFVQRLQNVPEVRHGMTFAHPRNADDVEEWFEEHVSDTDEEEGAQFVICVDGSPVGMASLFRVTRPESHAEIAYSVDPDEQGDGYATEAAELLVDYAINERRLHKVAARALVTNEASRTVLERVGFTQEELQREEMLVDGERVDVARYGLLEDEWR